MIPPRLEQKGTDTTMFRLAGVSLVGLVLVAACSGSGTPAPAATVTPAAVSGGVTVGTATTGLGVVLTGANGLTLYTHAGDTATTSTCTASCLAAWPPVTVASAQQAAAAPGVNGQLATFVRPEGSIQVTYDGQPLYYWQGDSKPGDVTGQGKAGFSVALASGPAPTSGGPSPSASGY
jgi:predicted lipoprotein with Yx(FWY)xxD motif